MLVNIVDSFVTKKLTYLLTYLKTEVINYLKICWQIKYFLRKFYLEILKWNFVWIGDWYRNFLVDN